MKTDKNVNGFDYSELAFYWKMLISGFVIILGVGYLSAAINATLAVGITPTAIAEHYGDKSLSEAERTMMDQQGFVEEEFSLDDEEDAADGMARGHDMGKMAGQAMAAGGVDDSLPPQVLAQLAHVHLLGFSLILLAVGSLFCLTRLSSGTKTLVVALLFLSFLGDIAGLNLTRFVSANFAWLTMIAGTLIGVCLAVMILRVLWELWGPRPAQS
ncbi:MAG: hypothetical protein ACE5ET_05265 [Gammaproteobacteria bacterium]